MIGAERGGASTELVLIAPVMLVLLAFAVVAGRIATASNLVTAAAAEAARAASIRDDPGRAAGDALSVARAAIATDGPPCRPLDVVVDTSNLRPGGEVSVALRCRVDLGDVVGFGMPGARVIEARAVEVVDRFIGP